MKHEDEQGEYWLARELQPLLEYGRWNELEAAIGRAKDDCAKSGRLVEENFRETPKVSGKRGPAQKDYRLTAYACRLITMTARTTGQNAAQARTYFADKVGEAERIETEVQGLADELGEHPLAEVAKRIILRQELTEANKRLIVRAEAAGVLSPKQRAVFMDSGYKGLYGGERENDIHARKELAPRERISSWMGAMETMANLLRAAVGEKRMERNNPQTPNLANKDHHEAGKAVRAFLTSEGIYPELLPTPTKSYEQIVKEEAERIRIEEENERGLWGTLPPEDKGSL
jgi:DNA-damage-inducible protein D